MKKYLLLVLVLSAVAGGILYFRREKPVVVGTIRQPIAPKQELGGDRPKANIEWGQALEDMKQCKVESVAYGGGSELPNEPSADEGILYLKYKDGSSKIADPQGQSMAGMEEARLRCNFPVSIP